MSDFRDVLRGYSNPKPAARRRAPLVEWQPVMSECSCPACRAGRLPELPDGMAEAFDAWRPYPVSRAHDEEDDE